MAISRMAERTPPEIPPINLPEEEEVLVGCGAGAGDEAGGGGGGGAE